MTKHESDCSENKVGELSATCGGDFRNSNYINDAFTMTYIVVCWLKLKSALGIIVEKDQHTKFLLPASYWTIYTLETCGWKLYYPTTT